MKIKDWDVNLKIKLLGEGFLNFSFWMVYPFLSVFFSESFGRTTASLLMIGSQALAVFLGLFGGYFSDQFGRKKMMLISVAGEAVGYGLFAIATLPMLYSPLLGFVGFSIASLFSSLYYPASQAMIADVISAKHRSYVFSVFYMMVNITIAIGPFIGSLFFTHYRFQLLTFVSFACVALFILLKHFAHETAPQCVKQKEVVSSVSLKDVFKSQIKNYQVILHDKVFMLYIIAGILLSQTLMQLDIFIPLKIHDTIDNATLLSIGSHQWNVTSSSLYSIVLAINGTMVATLTIVTAKIMMRFKYGTTFISSAIFYGVALLLFGIFSNPWIYLLCIIIFSIGELTTAGVQQNFVAVIAPEDSRAMYFSAAQLRSSIARVIAPISITFSAWAGSSATAFVLAALCGIAAIIYTLMQRMFHNQRKNVDTPAS